MFDPKWIRDNPDAFDSGRRRRGLPPLAEAVLALDTRRRTAQTAWQEMQARRNELSKQVGQLKAKGGDASAVMAEVAALKDQMAGAELDEQQAARELEDLLAQQPNLPAAEVPDGADESANRVEREIGQRRNFAFQPRQHFELGEALGLMDFATAAKISGARFVVLKGALARLERALGQFMLDMHTTEHGYTEINPPFLVRDVSLYGTGNLPKFAEDLFRTEQGHYLIPTSEVPLTNIAADEIIDEARLPLRFTALTPCFRSEAGAAGRDTRGMIRQHQFLKVELVSIAHPDESDAEHQRMTKCAENVLARLELPYRVVTLSTGDMGFASQKTHDIEVWLPGQGMFREISSCSNCGEFQARRMKARCRKPGEKGTRLVHTLNGSGVAVGRALIAVMENYQQEDGSVLIPAALQPYMNGLEVIKAHA
ncbi:seryl-tRNA synthetase [Dongia mobilis]|uniref:Serine--tRNA ligase n=1 Tax=Dongia mobilis TaxID=578943 RepID=A0A4R6WI76_9PROT|nr:serine--tRNA ligase [Dongia mobilis]TDQ77588.1 seryl-tRNA synthetase [Dongia mobilis]